jgi:hypothetical protein
LSSLHQVMRRIPPLLVAAFLSLIACLSVRAIVMESRITLDDVQSGKSRYKIHAQKIEGGRFKFHVEIFDKEENLYDFEVGLGDVVVTENSSSSGIWCVLSYERKDQRIICDFTVDKKSLENPSLSFVFSSIGNMSGTIHYARLKDFIHPRPPLPPATPSPHTEVKATPPDPAALKAARLLDNLGFQRTQLSLTDRAMEVKDIANDQLDAVALAAAVPLLQSLGCVELNLSHCPKLNSIEALRGLRSLSNLHLDTCASLQKLDGVKKLPALANLEISGCEGVENVTV